MKKFLYNPYVILFCVGVVVLLLFKSWKSIKLIFDKMSAKKDVKQYDHLQQVADEIYIAFHENWFGMFEDEQRAIRALKSAGVTMVREVALRYAKTGKNMYMDFQKYCSKSDFEKIKHLLA